MCSKKILILITKLNDGAVFKIAAKTPVEKKTERKPAENTSPFASKANTVIASLLPKYTPLSCFLPVLLQTISVMSSSFQLDFLPSFFFFARLSEFEDLLISDSASLASSLPYSLRYL